MTDTDERACTCGFPDCPRADHRDDKRRRAVLFNDVTRAYTGTWLPLGERQAIADYLWEQGWRRDVRPEDVTPPWDPNELVRGVDDPLA